MKYLSDNKTCIIIAICALLFASCAENLAVNDVQTLMLNDKVYSVEENYYFANYLFDKIVADKNLYKRNYKFDTSGRYIEFTHQDIFFNQKKNKPKPSPIKDSVEIIITDSCKIDADTIADTNDLIKCIDSVNLINKNENFIEPDYIRKEYIYLNDSIFIINIFDDKNHLLAYDNCKITKEALKIRTYDNNDCLLSKTDYYYDKKGRLINKIKYYEKISYQTHYKYKLNQKFESFS
jgi:hypothetical protein